MKRKIGPKHGTLAWMFGLVAVVQLPILLWLAAAGSWTAVLPFGAAVICGIYSYISYGQALLWWEHHMDCITMFTAALAMEGWKYSSIQTDAIMNDFQRYKGEWKDERWHHHAVAMFDIMESQADVDYLVDHMCRRRDLWP